MRLLICGDRNWPEVGPEAELIRNVIYGYITAHPLDEEFVLISGEAPGADSVATKYAKEYAGIEYKGYPAQWKIHGKAAGPIRNQVMLDQGRPDLVIAFHNNIEESTGTKDMLTRASNANVPCYLIGKY